MKSDGMEIYISPQRVKELGLDLTELYSKLYGLRIRTSVNNIEEYKKDYGREPFREYYDHTIDRITLYRCTIYFEYYERMNKPIDPYESLLSIKYEEINDFLNKKEFVRGYYTYKLI